ncbi:MAG TPA: glucose 1-dehydrogenase [Acetobacteraceae bacterium]|jgi:NAD(P)-dependent dehydrogenase (short-subunit alcohol dehydrogenase family)|nr:glucose 1-dehydrogenase [Acetobacteraceae bacterium]
MSWQEQVALVTGGSRGIGRATALRLAELGAAVAVNYATSAGQADSVVADVAAAGGRAMALCADVADAALVQEMVAQVARVFGPISILVNNAGLARQATLDTFDPDALARMRRVNVDGPIAAIRAVTPAMRERRYGRIVNITSIAGLGTALPGNAFYAGTKAELAILTRRFAMELGPHGITVNAVAPGFIGTEMARASRSGPAWAETELRLSQRAMVGRIGTPEDVANAVVFLAAPEAGFITAQQIVVDGGRMDYLGHG